MKLVTSQIFLLYTLLVGITYGQVTFTVDQTGYKEVNDKYWNPYVAWWIEDEQGKMVKLLYLTYYDDNTQSVNTLAGCEKAGYLSSLTFYTGERSFGPETYCPLAGEVRSGLSCGLKPYTTWEPDGVTACSAQNSGQGKVDKLSRTWDLTDRKGNKVPSGNYYVYFNSVIQDESKDPSDMAWRVPFTIGGGEISASSDQAFYTGSQAKPDMHKIKLSVTSGAVDGPTPGPNPSGSSDTLPNVIPTAPTVVGPEEPSLCGSGTFSAAFIYFAYVVGFRQRKRFQKRKQA